MELLPTPIRRLFARPHAPHDAEEHVVRAEKLTVRYDGTTALEDVSFHLHKGERAALVGPNGAGKSTLLKAIVGLEKPSSGWVGVYGDEPHGHSCIGYVPQRNNVDWRFPINVFDLVMMGRAGRMGLLRRPGARDRRKVREALELVRLQDHAGRRIQELSGGQQQRAFIARALAQEAEVLLMDEPFTGLDTTSQEAIFRALDTLKQRRVTVLVSLHDLNLAAERFGRVLLINRSLIFNAPAGEKVPADVLARAYGGHLHLIEAEGETLAFGDTCCGEGDEG